MKVFVVIRKLILLASGLLALNVLAQPRYCVRAGATGEGTGLNWNDAYPTLPSSLVRGATYYIATGSYSGRAFNTPVTNTIPITIKKATESEHGPNSGWTSSYGDGVARFSSTITFSSGYWVFDGAGRTSWTNGHGFKISHASNNGLNIEGPNVTIRYVETQGNGGDGGGSFPSNDSVAWRTGGNGDNSLLQYCYFYDAGRCIFFCNQSVSGVIIEHCYTGLMESTAAEHAETASVWGGAGSWTFRYNIFTHAEGTGGLILEGNTFLIYGNVFYRPSGDSWENGNGLIGTWTAATLTGCKIYHNTFIGIDSGEVFGKLFTPPTTGNESKNNLFYNVSGGIAYTLIPTHNYNHYINSSEADSEANGTSAPSGDPFKDYLKLDFSLNANTAAGQVLSSPFNLDPTGRIRSTWTRGAYEYVSSGAAN